MIEVLLNRDAQNDITSVIPKFHKTRSHIFFVCGAISLLCLLITSSYYIAKIRHSYTIFEQDTFAGNKRDSSIITSKNILDEMVALYEKGRMNPTQRYLLQSKLDNANTLFVQAKSKYFILLKDLPDSVSKDLLPRAQKYFYQADALIHNILMQPATIISRKNNGPTSPLSPVYISYNGIINNAFQELWSSEFKLSLQREERNSFVLRSYLLQWIIASIFLMGISILFIIGWVLQRREKSLQIKEYHTLLESSTTPILLIDRNGIVKYASPSFVAWTGMKPVDIVDMRLFDLVKYSEGSRQNENIWMIASEVLSSGKAWDVEVHVQRADGRKALSGMILSPVLDAHGNMIECIALHNDLTERREYTRKIVETQQQYRSIVESSLDGIMIIQDGKLSYVNPSAIRLFGYNSLEEMQKLKLADAIAPANLSSLEISGEGQTVGEEVLRNYEMRGLTKQGKIIDLEANAHVIDWNERVAVQASFRDITKRKMLEREQSLWLWEQETLSNIDRKLVGIMELEKIFAAILQQTLNLTRAHFAGVLLFDESRTFVQWKAICGNTLQHAVEQFKPPEAFESILKNERPIIIHESNAKELFPLVDIPIIGEEKIVSTAWMPLLVEGIHKGMIVVGYRHSHDFVGREMRLLNSLAEKHSIAMVNAQLYADLLQREKELEILSGARVQAQEDERRRIAREIHDGLGQMLTAIKFNLEILEDTISAGQEEKGRIQDMKGLLDDVMKEAREISYNLMPSVLDDFGLAPALQLLSEQFTHRANVKTQFHTSGMTDRLDPQIEIGLYRIAQESLNNVAKHAEATEVNVQLIGHSEGIRLIIEDNGKGISRKPDIVRVTGKGGMGLVSMRERAASFGGILTVDSTPKSGTFITVEIPQIKVLFHE